MATLYLFNKPYGVLSQFSDGQDRPTLSNFLKIPEIYPAGRLDMDSEGLLLLTDEGKLQHRIAHPDQKQPKTYWVQVEGEPDANAIKQLQQGLKLKDGMTKPAKARVMAPPSVWDRDPPIRKREKIPTTWVELTITEGRNRQVRRMTAAVGHPTLRLIRASIGEWSISDLEPGEFKSVSVQVPESTGSRSNDARPKKPAAGKPHHRAAHSARTQAGNKNSRNRPPKKRPP